MQPHDGSVRVQISVQAAFPRIDDTGISMVRAVAWATWIAKRSVESDQAAEIEACADCTQLRTQFKNLPSGWPLDSV